VTEDVMSDGAADVRWLTYSEIAEALGIARESARQLVIRKHWGRRKGNDGRARIAVPKEVLPIPLAPSDATSVSTPPPLPATAVDTPPAPSVGTSHEIELRIHVAVLEAELKALREVLEEMKRDRDRWHEEAVRRRPWWPFRRIELTDSTNTRTLAALTTQEN
jgi:hypothetical protein